MAEITITNIPDVYIRDTTGGCAICGAPIKDTCIRCEDQFCEAHLVMVCIMSMFFARLASDINQLERCTFGCRGAKPLCAPCWNEHFSS